MVLIVMVAIVTLAVPIRRARVAVMPRTVMTIMAIAAIHTMGVGKLVIGQCAHISANNLG